MRDLKEIARECMEEEDLLDIPYRTVSVWKVNTRALKRWGQCKRLPNGTFEININQDLLNENNDIHGLKNTIHHELLHTVEGCWDHGTKWCALAKRLNNAYGYHITRTNNADSIGVVDRREPIYKYAIKCPGCGKVLARRTRASDLTKNPNRYSCKLCGSRNLYCIKL